MIIKQCEELGRSKPQSKAHTVTAGEHFARFHYYSTTGIWTADGWLVTAVQDDGRTHHLRRADQYCRRVIDSAEQLEFFKITPAMKHWDSLAS